MLIYLFFRSHSRAVRPGQVHRRDPRELPVLRVLVANLKLRTVGIIRVRINHPVMIGSLKVSFIAMC